MAMELLDLALKVSYGVCWFGIKLEQLLLQCLDCDLHRRRRQSRGAMRLTRTEKASGIYLFPPHHFLPSFHAGIDM